MFSGLRFFVYDSTRLLAKLCECKQTSMRHQIFSQNDVKQIHFFRIILCLSLSKKMILKTLKPPLSKLKMKPIES